MWLKTCHCLALTPTTSEITADFVHRHRQPCHIRTSQHKWGNRRPQAICLHLPSLRLVVCWHYAAGIPQPNPSQCQQALLHSMHTNLKTSQMSHQHHLDMYSKGLKAAASIQLCKANQTHTQSVLANRRNRIQYSCRFWYPNMPCAHQIQLLKQSQQQLGLSRWRWADWPAQIGEQFCRSLWPQWKQPQNR